MTWLVTGGAGYIGAHVVRALTAAGLPVVVLDDLSSGHKERVPEDTPLVVGSVIDHDLIMDVVREHGVTGVVHMAARKHVGESMEKPLHYFKENVEGLRVLLEACATARMRSIVFSSSASVYGHTGAAPVSEQAPCLPISPYGETKLVGEWLVRNAARVNGMAYANLRYFNVAGSAAPELGDTATTNIIPIVFDRLAGGRPIEIYGDDYATVDGTCVRDFIHVQDLARAHAAAARLTARRPDLAALTLNLGTGLGSTVRQVVDTVVEVTGFTGAEIRVTDRRPGDPVSMVADPSAAHAALGWRAGLGLRDMVDSAWRSWNLLKRDGPQTTQTAL